MTSRAERTRPTAPSRTSSNIRSAPTEDVSSLVSHIGTSQPATIRRAPLNVMAKPNIAYSQPSETAQTRSERRTSVSFHPDQASTSRKASRAKLGVANQGTKVVTDGSTIRASKHARRQSASSALAGPRPFSPLALASAASDGLRSFFGSTVKAKPENKQAAGPTHPPPSFWQTVRRPGVAAALRADQTNSSEAGLPKRGRQRASLPADTSIRVSESPFGAGDRAETDTISRLGLITRTATPLQAVFTPPDACIPFPASDVDIPVTPPPVSGRLRTIKRSLSLFRSSKASKSSPQAALTSDSMQSMAAQEDVVRRPIDQRPPTRPSSDNVTPARLSRTNGNPNGTSEQSDPAHTARNVATGRNGAPPPQKVDRRTENQGSDAIVSGDGSPSDLSQTLHFDLRVAVLYLVKTVLPQILHRSNARLLNEDDEALRSVLEERLRLLQRMERAWGATWLTAKGSASGLRLSERTRLRESQTLRDALRDGVILCFLVNRMQGTRPALIPKISLLDLQASRDANVKAFSYALRALSISLDNLLLIGDLSDPGPKATERIVKTILALAKLAGPQVVDAKPAHEQSARLRTSRNGEARTGSDAHERKVIGNDKYPLRQPQTIKLADDKVQAPRSSAALAPLGHASTDRAAAHRSSTAKQEDAQNKTPLPEVEKIRNNSRRTSTPSLVLSSSIARSSWTLSDSPEPQNVSLDLAHIRDHWRASAQVASQDPLSPLPDSEEICRTSEYAWPVEQDQIQLEKAPMPKAITMKVTPPRRQFVRSISNPGRPSVVNEPSTPLGAKRESVVVTTHGHTAVYQLGNIIGRGQFGTVWRCLDISTGQLVAIKRISIEGLPEFEIEQLLQEVELLHQLKHPGIVRYEGMSRDSSYLNIVLEYIEGGSLGATVKSFGSFNETLASSYAAKIIEALSYLHASDVVHLDLKAANILTTKRGNLKLSDFGVSLSLRAVEKSREADVAGSPNWMAPEVIELKGASKAADIWSLGCTIIELITGQPPYAELRNDMAVMFRIVEDGAPPFPQGISDALRRFLRDCFQRDPLRRPTADELFQHEWVQNGLHFDQIATNNDSIPFLRRISMDVNRPDTLADIRRYMEQAHAESSRPSSLVFSDSTSPGIPAIPLSPMSPAAASSTDDVKHVFVRTRFGTTLECRLCAQALKRNAMICSECGLICHSTCAYTMVSTCTPQTGWTRSQAGSPNATGAVRFIDSPTPIRVRPTLSRISLSTPAVTVVRREGSQDDGLPDETDSARSTRLREETLAKLSGFASDRLTELPVRRRGEAPVKAALAAADLQLSWAGSARPHEEGLSSILPTRSGIDGIQQEDERAAECIIS